MVSGRNRSRREGLGIFLHNARKNANLTQKQAGEALEVDPSQVSRWETGENIPRDERAGPIAELYEIDEADLLHRLLAASDEEKAEVRRELIEVRRERDEMADEFMGYLAKANALMERIEQGLDEADRRSSPSGSRPRQSLPEVREA